MGANLCQWVISILDVSCYLDIGDGLRSKAQDVHSIRKLNLFLLWILPFCGYMPLKKRSGRSEELTRHVSHVTGSYWCWWHTGFYQQNPHVHKKLIILLVCQLKLQSHDRYLLDRICIYYMCVLTGLSIIALNKD